MPSAYEKLLDRIRDVGRMQSVAALLDWDQETQMPKGGVTARAEELRRAIDEFIAAAQSASQDLTSDQVIRMEDEALDGLRALGYIR